MASGYQPKVYRPQGGNSFVVASGGAITVESGGQLDLGSGAVLTGAVLNKRARYTAAAVEAGVTVLAAVAGFKYRVVDWTMIAIGGNAATATSVDLAGTQGAAAALLAVVAVAALTRSAAVKPNTANVTLLADGLSHIANDANTAITLTAAGAALATATHIDLILTYAMEA